MDNLTAVFQFILKKSNDIIIVRNQFNQIIYSNKIIDDTIRKLLEHKPTENTNNQYSYESNFVEIDGLKYHIEEFHDKSQEMHYELELKKDSLTGLINFKGLIEYLENNKNSNMTILFADIDNFKMINDTIGHNKANEILKALANILKKGVRKNDIAARYGGEEFILVFKDCELKDAYIRAEKIRDFINQNVRYEYNNQMFETTLSLGLAFYNGERTIQETIENADIAMYHSKQNGKNMTTIYNEKIKKTM